jgi:hypothetical protein
MTKRRFADRTASELAWQPPSDAPPPDLTRLAIDACLDTPLSDGEWNLLETQGWKADIRNHRRTPGQAAVMVEQWREAVAGPVRRARDLRVPASMRAEAVAHLVAVEARKTEPVIEFRTRVLRGKLLQPEQVDRWLGVIDRRQETKPWAKVYVSAEEAEVGVVPIGTSNLIEHGFDTLDYLVPDSGRVHHILVSSKGILGWLRWLSTWLCEQYRWESAHATMFILTDAAPPIPETHYEVDSRRAFPALTRVMMTVDPTMSPREVANLYRQIRFQYFGRRHRSMTPKHVELAKFWSTQAQSSTWKELMAEWNKQHRRWAYKREQNFARDCAQARERLLGQNLLNDTGQAQ